MTPNPINALKISICNAKHHKSTNTFQKSNNSEQQNRKFRTPSTFSTNKINNFVIYQNAISNIIDILYNCVYFIYFLYSKQNIDINNNKSEPHVIGHAVFLHLLLSLARSLAAKTLTMQRLLKASLCNCVLFLPSPCLIKVS